MTNTMMLLIGMWMSLTKKPMKPIMKNPTAVAVTVRTNSARRTPEAGTTKRRRGISTSTSTSAEGVWGGAARQGTTHGTGRGQLAERGSGTEHGPRPPSRSRGWAAACATRTARPGPAGPAPACDARPKGWRRACQAHRRQGGVQNPRGAAALRWLAPARTTTMIAKHEATRRESQISCAGRTFPVRLCAPVEEHAAVLGERDERLGVFLDGIHRAWWGW